MIDGSEDKDQGPKVSEFSNTEADFLAVQTEMFGREAQSPEEENKAFKEYQRRKIKEGRYNQIQSLHTAELKQSPYIQSLSNPVVEPVARGVDSEVFAVHSDEGAKIAKLYTVSDLNLDQIQKYAHFTNTLAQFTKEHPYQDNVSLGGETWDLNFVVVPVDEVDTLNDGTPFLVMDLIVGKNFEQLTMESSYTEEDVEMPSFIDGQSVTFSKELFDEFWNQWFTLKGDREELKLDQFINHTLSAKNFSPGPQNIIPQIDIEHRVFKCFITDIEGTLAWNSDISKS